MRRLCWSCLGAVVLALVWSCSSSPENATSTSETQPDASQDQTVGNDSASDAPDESTTEGVLDPSKIDKTAMATDGVTHEGESAQGVQTVKTVLHSFVQEDPTLAAGVDAQQNANNIQARVLSETVGSTSCVQTSTIKPSGAIAGDGYLTVVFDNCTLASSQLKVSGTVVVRVSGSLSLSTPGIDGGLLGDAGLKLDAALPDGSAPADKILVEFTFQDLKVNSYTVNGTVDISTTDLKNYPMSANLDVVPLGVIRFTGTGALSLVDGGTPAGTLDGTGTVDSSIGDGGSLLDAGVDPFAATGWTCTAGNGGNFTVVGLTRQINQCTANAGNVTLSKTYSCIKTVRGKDVTVEAKFNETVTWLATTPTDHKVQVKTDATIAGKSAYSDTETVTLPFACK